MAQKVMCLQINDGVQSGVETEVLPPVEGDTPDMILQRKADSHANNGWTVKWQGSSKFTATKLYPGLKGVKGCAGEVIRNFRIVTV